MSWGDFLLGAVAYKFFIADGDEARRRREATEAADGSEVFDAVVGAALFVLFLGVIWVLVS